MKLPWTWRLSMWWGDRVHDFHDLVCRLLGHKGPYVQRLGGETCRRCGTMVNRRERLRLYVNLKEDQE